jgi:hypothetical protein
VKSLPKIILYLEKRIHQQSNGKTLPTASAVLQQIIDRTFLFAMFLEQRDDLSYRLDLVRPWLPASRALDKTSR